MPGSTVGPPPARPPVAGIRHQVVRRLKIVIDQLGVTKETQGGTPGARRSASARRRWAGPQALADALTQPPTTASTRPSPTGKLSEERATMKSKAPERVDQFLNRMWGQHAAQSPNAA
jgi:hypothetical protein